MKYYFPAVLRRKMEACQQCNFTATQAAEHLGLSRAQLNVRRRAFGLPLFRPENQAPRRRRGPRHPWTPDDEVLLACCVASGCEKQQTADVLGRRVYNVDEKRRMLGLRPFARPDWRHLQKKWKGARLARLRALRAEGLPFSLIAKRFGVSRNAIAGAVSRYLQPQ